MLLPKKLSRAGSHFEVIGEPRLHGEDASRNDFIKSPQAECVSSMHLPGDAGVNQIKRGLSAAMLKA